MSYRKAPLTSSRRPPALLPLASTSGGASVHGAGFVRSLLGCDHVVLAINGVMLS